MPFRHMIKWLVRLCRIFLSVRACPQHQFSLMPEGHRKQLRVFLLLFRTFLLPFASQTKGRRKSIMILLRIYPFKMYQMTKKNDQKRKDGFQGEKALHR